MCYNEWYPYIAIMERSLCVSMVWSITLPEVSPGKFLETIFAISNKTGPTWMMFIVDSKIYAKSEGYIKLNHCLNLET